MVDLARLYAERATELLHRTQEPRLAAIARLIQRPIRAA